MKRLDAPFFYWDTPYTLYGTALLLWDFFIAMLKMWFDSHE